MAQELDHINQENVTRFSLLGSPAAQAETDALLQAGTRCLKTLYAEATLKQSQLQKQAKPQSDDEWNELQTHIHALERAIYETTTPGSLSPKALKRKHVLARHSIHQQCPPAVEQITGGAILAASAGRGLSPAARDMLDMQIRREQDDHEAFMQALSPDAKTLALLTQGSTDVRGFLLADVKKAIAGPPPIEGLHLAAARYEGMFERQKIGGLDDAHRADTAWQREHNSWRNGLELGPLLARTEYTDSEDPVIIQTAQRLLTMPRVGNILQQRFPDGNMGYNALVNGPDGRSYTFEQLASHPSYCHLVEADGLWNTLHSPAMDRLLDQAHHSDPLANFTVEQLNLLAMAQRIASVVIHYAVRDSIHYTFGAWQQTAPEVLRARQGSCSGSANLTVALARAARVPAGAIRMHVETPGYFGRAAIPNAVGGRNRVSVHFQVGWITLQSVFDPGLTWHVVKSDPSDEYDVGAGLEHFNSPRSRVTRFDGSHDCILLFPPEEVFDHVGPLAVVDPLLRKQRPLVPSISQRLEVLRRVDSRGSVSIETVLQLLAAQIMESPYQGRYDLVAQSYKIAQENLLVDPLAVAAFPGKTFQQLGLFLNDPSTLAYMLDGILDGRTWADRILDFAVSREMKTSELPDAADLAPRLLDIVRSLCGVLNAIPEEDRTGLPLGLVAWTEHRRTLQICSNQAEWARRLGNIYQFMTQCYPSVPACHYGPRAAPHWLNRSSQERYLSYIRSEASVESMRHPNDSALSFLLGKNASRYRDDQGKWSGKFLSICNKAGIDMEEVYQVAKFHAHLLCDVATVTWERYSCFMRQRAEGIRCSTDCAVEFEAWLHHKDPILAALHRDDLWHDPTYPDSVCRYLSPRAVAQSPSLIRTGLAEFIELIEAQPADLRPTQEAEMDSLLREFLRGRTEVSMDALFGERKGGWLKPYGVLYTLWKVYTLPLEEAIRMAKHLIRSSHEQFYRNEQDWLGSVAKSYPYRSWNSTARQDPRFKAAAML